MPQHVEFRLPDVGEGLTEAGIVDWLVSVAETVTVNRNIVEIETAKSLVELPSPSAGVVTELLVASGDTVAVGTPIIRIDTGGTGGPSGQGGGSGQGGATPPTAGPPAGAGAAGPEGSGAGLGR